MKQDELEIVYIDEKELLAGLLQITNNLGAAYSLLDRVRQQGREEVQATLKEIQNNIGPEKRNARRRASRRLKKSMGGIPWFEARGYGLTPLSGRVG